MKDANPPDAVSGAATPEQQCKCKCVFCFEGHHHRCVRGCDWIPFSAATPEARDEYEQCCLDYYALRNERDALRVERDKAWNEALEAALKVIIEGECLSRMGAFDQICKLARPIPAEKPDRETK
jgi:hypothetical protein